MPFKSKAQQRFMYANKAKMKAQGVDVDEWASKTDFSKLPEKKKEKKDKGEKMKDEKKDKAASLAIAYIEKRSSADRQLVDTLKRVKAAAEHEVATTEDVDVAIDIVHGQKQAAASWAKKLVKKYKAEGKTVPEWLEKMTGAKKAAMEKNAIIGRMMAGAGRQLARGGVGRMFGGRMGRLGARMGVSGLGRRMGKGLMRRGGLLEAGGGVRGLMGRNPLMTAGTGLAAGMGLSSLFGGGSQPPAAQQTQPPAGGQPMGQQLDPRVLQFLMMLQGGGYPKMGMEKNAVLGIGAAGRLLGRMGMRRAGLGLRGLNRSVGGTRLGGLINRMQGGAKNLMAAGQTATTRLPGRVRSQFGKWREARRAARSRRAADRVDRMIARPDPVAEARLNQEMMGAVPAAGAKSVPIGGSFKPGQGLRWGVGKALRYGLPIGAGVAGGYALARGGDEAESGDAAQQVASGGQQPNFIQRMMGGLGDYVGEDLGMESLGNMIRENPYASLGVGVGGGGLLMYLLYQLLAGGGGGRQPQMAAMYG